MQNEGTSPAFTPSLYQVGLGTALAVLIFVYPLLFNRVISDLGVRIGALALLAYAAVFALARQQMGVPVQLLSLPHV